MADREGPTLILKNRTSGEVMALRRVKRGGEVWVELKGSLTPHREGPPLHIQLVEDEEGQIKSGTVAFVFNGISGWVRRGIALARAVEGISLDTDRRR
ncbi:MAG: hypothetical protein ABI836_07940 [Gemmatimonadota bacterium]